MVKINLREQLMRNDEIKKLWDNLLISTRIRESENSLAANDARNPFDNDYSRVVMSSALRRLQDKTQVFPLEKEDFVRTRLTHSLEVSYFGENIGKSLEKILIDKKMLDASKMGYIPKILATAGLVHDLGNPPFGHYGEECIKNFFEDYFKERDKISEERLVNDLQFFDGNVQTFRILTKLQFLGKEGGFNLTYPTLATIVKYPNGSDYKSEKNKIGYYCSEEKLYKKIINELMPEMEGKRYPLTFLLEAADDIAYCIADIEDGIQKRLLKLSDIKEKLKECLKEEINKLDGIEEKVNELTMDEAEKEKLMVQNLKIFLQGKMVSEVVEAFVKNQEAILKGKFQGEILQETSCQKIREELSELTKEKIFKSKEIIEGEVLGYKVIRTLLENFVNAEMDVLTNNDHAKKQSKKLKSLISGNYKYICEEIENKELEKLKGLKGLKYDEKQIKIYNSLKLCVDFVSGMTDNYALNLFRKINGLNI